MNEYHKNTDERLAFILSQIEVGANHINSDAILTIYFNEGFKQGAHKNKFTIDQQKFQILRDITEGLGWIAYVRAGFQSMSSKWISEGMIDNDQKNELSKLCDEAINIKKNQPLDLVPLD